MSEGREHMRPRAPLEKAVDAWPVFVTMCAMVGFPVDVSIVHADVEAFHSRPRTSH